MDVIMVPYRHQNKKAFLVDRISSYRQTVCAIDNISELLRQSDEPHLLKACLDPVELQLGEASVLYLPVYLVCHLFFNFPQIGIYIPVSGALSGGYSKKIHQSFTR